MCDSILSTSIATNSCQLPSSPSFLPVLKRFGIIVFWFPDRRSISIMNFMQYNLTFLLQDTLQVFGVKSNFNKQREEHK